MEKSCCDSCENGDTCESKIPSHVHKKGNTFTKHKPVKTVSKFSKYDEYETNDNSSLNEDYRSINDPRKVNDVELMRRVNIALNVPRSDKSNVEIIDDVTTVIEAIIRPDLYRNIGFPTTYDSPGVPIPKYNTIDLKTNALGVCWVEVNLGQYLGSSATTGFSAATGVVTGNEANGGLFNLGRSNVFISNPQFATFNGTAEYNPGVSASGWCIPVDTMVERIDMYNAVRAGPASIWYDFTGRFDASQGTLTAGINYSYVRDLSTAGATTPNGLLPDLFFSNKKAIEDCPYKITGSVVNSVQAIFLPQDSKVLELKNPQQGNDGIQQRFFLLIVGAAPNEVIGQLRIAMNFDGKPSARFADSIGTSITKTPSITSLKDATNYLISNGLVVRQSKDTGYGLARFNQI